MKRIVLMVCAMMTVAATGWTQSAQQDPADDMKDCPMHAQHQATKQHDHDQEMIKRGDQGMGFAQAKTTHHFLLSKDGGTIQVTANTGDKTSIEQIRRHFEHISHAFQSGDFNIPMFVHDQTPPGVATMTRLKGNIRYQYEEIEKGARVVISSDDAEAVKAVHQFLQFQISEHKTGDSLEAK